MTTLARRIELGEFFSETVDPALQESADRGPDGAARLPPALRAVGAPAVADAGPRLQPGPRATGTAFPEEERFQRMYGLSSFFIGEQKVTEELGPMMRAAPTEEMKVFLATQIADEARHVRFFDRFYSEVGVLEADSLTGRLEETERAPQPRLQRAVRRDARLARRSGWPRSPSDLETLVEAVTLYHMVIEGMLALTGQHFIIDFNEREGTLPGFVRGFNLVARDEHRHVAFGARFLRDMVARGPAVQGVDPAHARGVASARRQRADAAVGGGHGRRLRALRRDASTRRATSPPRRSRAG